MTLKDKRLLLEKIEKLASKCWADGIDYARGRSGADEKFEKRNLLQEEIKTMIEAIQ
jgi:hypothetical protein